MSFYLRLPNMVVLVPKYDSMFLTSINVNYKDTENVNPDAFIANYKLSMLKVWCILYYIFLLQFRPHEFSNVLESDLSFNALHHVYTSITNFNLVFPFNDEVFLTAFLQILFINWEQEYSSHLFTLVSKYIKVSILVVTCLDIGNMILLIKINFFFRSHIHKQYIFLGRYECNTLIIVEDKYLRFGVEFIIKFSKFLITLLNNVILINAAFINEENTVFTFSWKFKCNGNIIEVLEIASTM